MPTFTNKQHVSWSITLCIPLLLEIIYVISVFYDVTQACEGLTAKPVLKLKNSLAIILLASNEALWARSE
jgi:hypothetical protein